MLDIELAPDEVLRVPEAHIEEYSEALDLFVRGQDIEDVVVSCSSTMQLEGSSDADISRPFRSIRLGVIALRDIVGAIT